MPLANIYVNVQTDTAITIRSAWLSTAASVVLTAASGVFTAASVVFTAVSAVFLHGCPQLNDPQVARLDS